VLQQVIALARKYRIFLHAHADADAIKRIFASNPDALVIWAHSGFESPAGIAPMLQQYPNLWSDLAFRSEHSFNGVVDADWQALFERFPRRFMLGTDTYTPERGSAHCQPRSLKTSHFAMPKPCWRALGNDARRIHGLPLPGQPGAACLWFRKR
jgi:hypothetical protein